MKNIVRFGTGAFAAALALALSGGVASAQLQKAPEAPKAAAETKAAPAKRAATKPKSACKGLDEAACGSTLTCKWIGATKTKAGKDVKAYCRTAPKPKAAKATPAPKAKAAAPTPAKAPAKAPATAPAAPKS